MLCVFYYFFTAQVGFKLNYQYIHNTVGWNYVNKVLCDIKVTYDQCVCATNHISRCAK